MSVCMSPRHPPANLALVSQFSVCFVHLGILCIYHGFYFVVELRSVVSFIVHLGAIVSFIFPSNSFIQPFTQ